MTLKLNAVQQALITRLKAATLVTNLLPDKLDIREVEWQGTDFGYPNIRVRVEKFQRHQMLPECNLFDVEAIIFVFAEDASSMIVNSIIMNSILKPRASSTYWIQSPVFLTRQKQTNLSGLSCLLRSTT